jgi:hypothetical protein
MSVPTTDKEVKNIFKYKYRDRPKLAQTMIEVYLSYRKAGCPVIQAYIETLEVQITVIEEPILRWKDEIEREKSK